MNLFRRPLLILLNPHPPLWAHAGVWVIGGFGLIISARLIDPRGPNAWFGDAIEVLGFILVLLAAAAAVLRRAQLDWHTKQLIKRGAGLCPNCAYDLRALSLAKCPECGTDIDAATREAARLINPRQ